MCSLGVPTTERNSFDIVRPLLCHIPPSLFRELFPFACSCCCPHACTTAVPRELQRLINSNPRMVTTGLPLLQVTEYEQTTSPYSLSRSASLSDNSSCRGGRVSALRSGSISSHTSMRASSVSAPAVRVISLSANNRLSSRVNVEP